MDESNAGIPKAPPPPSVPAFTDPRKPTEIPQWPAPPLSSLPNPWGQADEQGYHSSRSPWPDFKNKTPDVKIDPLHFLMDTIHTPREICVMRATTENLSFIIAQQKEQDAIGVAIAPDGKINIVVADGTTTAVVPEVAARAAVRGALSQLEHAIPSELTFAKAHAAIYGINILELAEDKIRIFKEAADSQNNPVKRLAYEASAKQLQEYFNLGKVAKTMLAVAQYDRKKGILHIANRGDTSIVIFRANGEVLRYTGEEGSSFKYDMKNPDAPYVPKDDDVVKDISLNNGDVVLVQSDGLEKIKGIEAKIGEFIKQHQGESRLDIAIVSFIREQIKVHDPDDDVAIVVLQHQP